MPTLAPAGPVTRDLELEALQRAVRWPNPHPHPSSILALAGRFLARGQDQAGYASFQERAAARPDQPLFQALAGLFQVRLAAHQPATDQAAWLREALARLDAAAATPGLTTYFRGLALADLPASVGRAEAAVADLEWVLLYPDRVPVGFRRSAYQALARAYAALGRDADARLALERSGSPALPSDEPVFTADYWLTAQDGFHFVPPRLLELAPRVYVAQGYDFGDFGFVLTDDGIVAVDAGTTEAHARAALQALRAISDQPIRLVILTHAHWDHIGGVRALLGPGTQIVAQAGFADELEMVNQTGVGFRLFFAGQAKPAYHVEPDRLVHHPEQIVHGGTTFSLLPVHGGETEDGLLVHLPERGVVFVGDVVMPYLGAPFLPEGSAEGLFDTMRLVQRLAPTPRKLIHGHPALTDFFTLDIFPALEAALRELHQRVLAGIQAGCTLVQILHENVLPDALHAQPAAVVPYLVMRENVVKRTYHRRTGYWKPDGEGIDVFGADEWAAALGLLADGREDAFIRSAGTLLDQHAEALALRLVELGLRRFPESQALRDLRRRTLNQLRAVHQQLNPFKFIVYSEWAEAELVPAA